MTVPTPAPPGLLIAGNASGVGKTTVTLALISALRRRGLVVQPFKGGPDFLDTGHQSRIAGRAARNLDTWMLSHESNRQLLRDASRGADALIVEGMMGLFDGKDGATEVGSSAEIAKILKLPVVLVLDASKSARSIAAVVLGFETFDPALPLAGIILNRVAGDRHYHLLATAIGHACRTPLLGWLPREPSIAIPERHLGLHDAEHLLPSDLEEQREALADLAEKHIQVDKLLQLRCGLDLTAFPAPPTSSRHRNKQRAVRIGIARDAAFTFYYEDNLDLLRNEGAEIVSFSPMHDQDLPPALDALYFGGGYPELHCPALGQNATMLAAIRAFAASKRPVYAECGGMMYLATSITTMDGKSFGMAGLLPFSIEMTSRLVRFGYVTVELTQNCILGPAGTVIRGHSFHHSRLVNHQSPNDIMSSHLTTSYRLDYSLSGEQQQEGFGLAAANILASYIHLPFRANPSVARHLAAAARLLTMQEAPGPAPQAAGRESADLRNEVSP